MVNSTLLLQEARQNKTFLPAFNIYNLETIQGAFLAAKQANKPVILAFGEGYLKYVDFPVIVAMVKALDADHSLPVVLHLDHCKSVDTVKRAIDCGFTSVMYDGSHLTLEENIKHTKEVVAYARERNVSVEGELGYMNTEEGGAVEKIEYTDPVLAEQYVKETGIDSLAVAIGNAHGVYHGTPHLQFSVLEELYKRVQIPIVLHGGSGIPKDQIEQAVSMAVAKININTEIALAGGKCLQEALALGEVVRLELLMDGVRKKVTSVMEGYFS